MDASLVALSAALLLLLVVVLVRHLVVDTRPLPPGPPTHWLYGNTIPKRYQWRVFEQYTKQYGPLFTLRSGLFGRKITIVVGSYQAASDLMEKQGAHFADRPRTIAAGETLSGGMRTLLLPYGERLKRIRKTLHSHLQPRVAAEYAPVQEKASRVVVADILSKQSTFQDHLKRYAASVIMTLTYGKTTPTTYADPEVQSVLRGLNRLGRTARPGAYLVDSFPWMRYIPGYLSELKKHHREELELFRNQLDAVKSQIAAGTAGPSFARYIIEKQSELGLSDDESAYVAGTMFGAGSDSTAAAIAVVILAATLFPEEQRKVQEELDSVVGQSMPSMDECLSLPCLGAFVLETYRWRPVSAGGFYHKSTADVVYNGHLIPKGTDIIGNHTSIHNDPSVFPDPEEFRPARWLTEKGTLREDLRTFVFGFGRRVCPGQFFAHRSVTMNAASLMWAFSMSPECGSIVDPMAFTDGLTAHPMPFKVNFEHRFEQVPKIVEDTLGAS